MSPQNRNPQKPHDTETAGIPAPYRGYQNINIRSHFGTCDYDALQVQLNRRYVRGVQFAVAYTYGRTRGVADEDEGVVSAVRPLRER